LWEVDVAEQVNRPRTDLWSMADLATPMALRVVATLRIAELIAQAPQTVDDLARTANVDADALDRVLRHLVTVDVVERDRAGAYSLTSHGAALREDHDASVRDALDIEGAVGRADLSFVQLLHTVRTGEAAFPAHYGREFWDDLSRRPAVRASYDRQMGTDAARWARSIVPAYDWGSLGHVVDVGGGNGTLLVALLRAHPSLRGTVFDRPETIEAAEVVVTNAGLADRCDLVAGNFFDPLPTGAGGYLLCAILHDWPDDEAVEILRRCADASASDGTVLVIEKTDRPRARPRTEMDLRLLAYFGGREREVDELSSLAPRADLAVAAVHAAGELSILELRADRP
jgi:hypothetical protein